MSNAVRLASALPADAETNGLDSKALRLVEEPEKLLVCLVWGDTQKIVTDTDSGDQVPYFRIRRIEPLGDVDKVPDAVRDLVQDAIRKRTGRTPIPFESGHVAEGYDPDQAALDENED